MKLRKWIQQLLFCSFLLNITNIGNQKFEENRLLAFKVYAQKYSENIQISIHWNHYCKFRTSEGMSPKEVRKQTPVTGNEKIKFLITRTILHALTSKILLQIDYSFWNFAHEFKIKIWVMVFFIYVYFIFYLYYYYFQTSQHSISKKKHYYIDDNHHFSSSTLSCQHRSCLNVWSGIIRTLMIGTYFFDAVVLMFIMNSLLVLFEDLSLNVR